MKPFLNHLVDPVFLIYFAYVLPVCRVVASEADHEDSLRSGHARWTQHNQILVPFNNQAYLPSLSLGFILHRILFEPVCRVEASQAHHNDVIVWSVRTYSSINKPDWEPSLDTIVYQGPSIKYIRREGLGGGGGINKCVR